MGNKNKTELPMPARVGDTLNLRLLLSIDIDILSTANAELVAELLRSEQRIADGMKYLVAAAKVGADLNQYEPDLREIYLTLKGYFEGEENTQNER